MTQESVLDRAGNQIKTWGSLVKFSHTIFALPFALSMIVIVARQQSISLAQTAWILLALATARTSSMAFNRYVDRHIDSKNPRTVMRELPAGKVSEKSVLILIVANAILFFFAAAMLGVHCLLLAPLVLGILMFYSYTKRFTSFSHVVLGLALAMAPGGAWYALTARFDLLPVVLMTAVLMWVAGFDMLYSCQDEHFDRQNSLHSVPAALGARGAFALARSLHLSAFLLLLVFGQMAGLGGPYYVGVLVFGGLLANQHSIISPSDLSRIDAAFFTRNGLASVVFFLAVLSDFLMR
jgi:4-hydroxybenzoate polyprenyltransferase